MAFGSKCAECGYNKSLSALDIHHLDPEEKEFGIGRIRANPKSWNKIVEELRKCVLLCANCHREVHAGDLEFSNNWARFDEAYANYKKPEQEIGGHCPCCGSEKPKSQKTCSRKCSSKLTGTIDWDQYDLHELTSKYSFEKIGRIIGCSGAAVKKRYIKIKE